MRFEVTSIAEVDYIINELDGNQFEALPHYARVALAARFARQTVSLFGITWPEVPTYGSKKYLQIIKQVEDYAAYAEPVSDIETLRNDAIISLGAIRRSIYGREDDSVPTADEEQFVIQADEATRIVELALATTQSTPAESAGIVQRIFVRFSLLFDENEPDLCMSMVDDFRKLCEFSKLEMWDDRTLVAPQIFDKDSPVSPQSSTEKSFESIDAFISSRWFYGISFIVLACWSQLEIGTEVKETLWYGVTFFNLSWTMLGLLLLAGSKWAIGVYIFSSLLLGFYAIYFGLVDAFTINRIVLLAFSLYLLYSYRDIVDAVKKD